MFTFSCRIFKDLYKIMVNKASGGTQDGKNYIKMHLCKTYVCKDNFKFNNVTAILGKPDDRKNSNTSKMTIS